MEYPGNRMLYEVACGLLFPSPEAAQKQLECVRRARGKPSPPCLNPKTNPLTDPKTTPDKPQN